MPSPGGQVFGMASHRTAAAGLGRQGVASHRPPQGATTRQPGGRATRRTLRSRRGLPPGWRVVGLRQVDGMPHGPQRARSVVVRDHTARLRRLVGIEGNGGGERTTKARTTQRPQHNAEPSHSAPVVLSACCKEGSTAVTCGTPRRRPGAGQRASPGTVDRFPSSKSAQTTPTSVNGLVGLTLQILPACFEEAIAHRS